MNLKVPKKKKYAIFVLTLLMLFSIEGGGVFSLLAARAAGAQPPIAVTINGEQMDFDVSPQIVADRALVPLRGIFEHLQAVVTWDSKTRTVTAVRAEDNRTVSLTIGSSRATVNGDEVALEVPPLLFGDRTLIPLRFVAEALGAAVRWEAAARKVVITTTSPSAPEEEHLTGSEIFARHQEAVVQVCTYDARGRELASGTGFNISPRGAIVTSYHVLEGAAAVEIFFGEQRYPVQGYLAADPQKDLVVLALAEEALPVVPLAESSPLTAGEEVVVIGYPLKEQKTFSEGRASPFAEEGMDYILTTAPVARGSSGSPLFNAAGRVLGVIVASFTDGQNYNLAVPVSYLPLHQFPAEPLPLEDLLAAAPSPEGEEGEEKGEEQEEVFSLPLDFFSTYLQEYHSQIVPDPRNQIQFFHVYAEEGKDSGTILLLFLMNKENFHNWLLAFNEGGESKIKEWAQEVFQAVEAIYPHRELTAGIMVQDYFLHYPSHFPAGSIEMKDDGYYVEHFVGYFYHLAGKRQYQW